MKIIDNVHEIVKDDMVKTICKGSTVSVAAACFSMYAYKELKKQLNSVSEFLEDISEDEMPNEATGFKNSKIWSMLYDFQKDAVLAIAYEGNSDNINSKLNTQKSIEAWYRGLTVHINGHISWYNGSVG